MKYLKSGKISNLNSPWLAQWANSRDTTILIEQCVLDLALGMAILSKNKIYAHGRIPWSSSDWYTDLSVGCECFLSGCELNLTREVNCRRVPHVSHIFSGRPRLLQYLNLISSNLPSSHLGAALCAEIVIEALATRAW